MWRLFRRLLELEYFAGEYLGDMLIPSSGPGRLWRAIFRGPLVLYKYGLHFLISEQVLLLTTIGRKTGKQRTTPVGYRFDAATGAYFVVAGWKGKTDWYQNALAQPAVSVVVGNSRFDALATPADDETVARHLAAYDQRNPFAKRLYLRLTGITSDGRHETFLKMAPFYPTLMLRRGERR